MQEMPMNPSEHMPEHVAYRKPDGSWTNEGLDLKLHFQAAIAGLAMDDNPEALLELNSEETEKFMTWNNENSEAFEELFMNVCPELFEKFSKADTREAAIKDAQGWFMNLKSLELALRDRLHYTLTDWQSEHGVREDLYAFLSRNRKLLDAFQARPEAVLVEIEAAIIAKH